MAQKRAPSLKIRKEKASRSLIDSWSSLITKTTAASFSALLSILKTAVKTTTPPLLPLVAVAACTPFLILASLFVGLYVWRSGAVSWKASLDLQYGDGFPPYAEAVLPAMSPVEPYDILLHLTMPATQANYDLGNFMTSLSLNTTKTKTLVSVRKPAILLPPPLSLIFPRPKTARLTVPMLSQYITAASKVTVRVELGRRDFWKSLGSGHGREVSVLSATLEGVLKYRGIRGFVSKYPILAAALSASAFFTVSFVTVAILLAPALLWSYDGSEDGLPVKTESSRLNHEPQDDKSRKKTPLRRSGSRSIEQIKLEPTEVLLHPTTRSSAPLRRRRRSQLSEQSSSEE